MTEPTLRERAAVIMRGTEIRYGTLRARLGNLLHLTDTDLDVLFSQQPVATGQPRNEFDIIFELLTWKISVDDEKIAAAVRQSIVQALEARNWRVTIALLIKALDNGF